MNCLFKAHALFSGCLLLATTHCLLRQLAGILAAGRSIKRRHDVKGEGIGGRVLIPLHATFPTAFFAATFAQCQGTNTHTRCTHLLLLLLLLLRVLAKCKLRWRRRPPVVAIIAPRQFQMKAGVSNVNFCQATPCGGKCGRGQQGVLPK